MQICYIHSTTILANTLQVPVDSNWLERAIGGAIQHTIVEPFQNWCCNMWCGFVDASLPICTTASLIGLIFSMIGVKKAKQWVIIPIIVYLFIQILNYIVAGGAL